MTRQTVYLLPLGLIDVGLLGDIASAVEEAFGFPVSRLPSDFVPQHAYESDRGQYHSTTILSILAKRIPEDALRLLVIADVDLYVSQLNFVFGEAAVDGRISIISLYRLRPEYYGTPQNGELLTERAVKEAIHELGHTFGLHHCPDPRCVMCFSNSIADTDRKSAGFRGECAEQLRSKLQSLKNA